MEIRSSTRVGCDARAVHLGPRISRGRTSRARRRLLVAETCRVRRRLIVRGGDSSCEAETCRGGSSSGKLVGDEANWPKTRRLASVGLDQDLLSSLS
jgi:hypothetical protein